jgi:DNA polymerase-3 subunit beta
MFIKNVERETLLKPLQIVGGIVERKQPLPILSNVLIEKVGDRLRFVATDVEIQITASILHPEPSDKDTAITVSARKMQDILRVLPDDSKVSLDIQDNRLQIKANKSRFNLQTLPAQDFPKAVEPSNLLEKVEVPQQQLKKLFGMVQYAMAQQDIRYYLNGVLLVVEKKTLKLVATDGHRLAFACAELDKEYEKREIILPRKTVNELIKLLADTDDKIALDVTENQVRIALGDVTLTSKVIDGKFPDYERVVPKYTNHLTLDRMTIAQALQRAAILSNEKFRGVRFVLTEKNLRIVSSNSEQEEAQEDLETDYHGPALDIGFNVNYLLDGLSSVSTPEVIFSFGDPNSSILMTVPDNEDFKYVVMPMRI